MEIVEVEWAEGVREKVITKHQLDPDEVEDSFFEPGVRLQRGRSGRYVLWAQTPAGALRSGVLRVQQRPGHGHHSATHE